MQRFWIFLVLVAPLSAKAGSASVRDAFTAYVSMRSVEEEEKLVSTLPDLEPEERATKSQALSARLTEARIHFHEVLRSDRASLSPWELATLERVSRQPRPAAPRELDPRALSFLTEAFPSARRWSAIEWQSIGEWFGSRTQDAFLARAFEAEEAKPVARTAGAGRLLWIRDPFDRALPKPAAKERTRELEDTRRSLERAGYRVEVVELSPFAHLDEQAEELRLVLGNQLDAGPATLFTAGDASAILHKTFDLNPGLLHRPEIRGWINLNGRLFGRKPAEKASGSRAPASVVSRPLSREALVRQPALGAQFPVVNLVSVDERHRPSSNLRESLVEDGRTLLVRQGDGLAHLPAALAPQP